MLVQPFSEGLLLLPQNNKPMDADLEATVMTSLMGPLWKSHGVQTVRLEVPCAKEDDTTKSSKKSWSLFRKSWNDIKEDNIIK